MKSDHRVKFWNDLGLPIVGPHLSAHDATIIHRARDELNHALDLIEWAENRLKKLDQSLGIEIEIKVVKS